MLFIYGFIVLGFSYTTLIEKKKKKGKTNPNLALTAHYDHSKE